MRVSSLTVGAFQENCYLVADEVSGEAVLVDPGAEGERILHMVKASGMALRAIWLTHAHVDHIGAIAAVKRVHDVPIWMHPDDQPLYERGAWQAANYGLPFEQPPAVDHHLADGQLLRIGESGLRVLHTPGHAPGHCVFEGERVLIAGDLLFAGSIGRTDLPFSDPRAMARSLARVSALDPGLVVHPGHGPATTIARELEGNPFLNGVARVAGG